MKNVKFADTPRDFILHSIGETIEINHSVLWVLIGDEEKRKPPTAVNFREWLPIILETYERTGEVIRALKVRFFIANLDEIEREMEFIKTHFYEESIPWHDYSSS